MRLTEAAPRPVFHSPISPARTAAPSSHKVSSQAAVEEINAYIAIRDLSLADAERVPTRGTLDRALLANEFVESCLRPARSPYQAQSLPEANAVTERQRCAAAKVRLAQLSSRLSDHRCVTAA